MKNNIDKIKEFYNVPREEWSNKLFELQDSDLFDYFSYVRGSIVRWLDILEGQSALVYGVDAYYIREELSAKSEEIVYVDSLEDFESLQYNSFDYVILFKVLEECGPMAIREFADALSDEGQLILIEDNKLAHALNLKGFKFDCGYNEELLEGYNARDARKYSKTEIEIVLKDMGFESTKFYYPFPNYKYMMSLYTDDRLPEPEELTLFFSNIGQSDSFIVPNQDVYGTLVREGLFSKFNDSYVVIASRNKISCDYELLFLKDSCNRKPAYRMSTEIIRRDEKLYVRKKPILEAANKHIQSIVDSSKNLSKQYDNQYVYVAKSHFDGDAICMEYLDGSTVEAELDKLYEQDKLNELFSRIEDIFNILIKPEDEYINIDLIFSNIICMADGRLGIIDYEWTFRKEEFPEDIQDVGKLIRFRALREYVLHNDKSHKIELDSVLKKFDISQEEIDAFLIYENAFQGRVYDTVLSPFEYRKQLGVVDYKFPEQFVTKQEAGSVVEEIESKYIAITTEKQDYIEELEGRILTYDERILVYEERLRHPIKDLLTRAIRKLKK